MVSYSWLSPRVREEFMPLKWFWSLDQVRLTLGIGILTTTPQPFSQTACPLSATFSAQDECPFCSSAPEKPFPCLPNSWGPASYLPMEGYLGE